MKTRKCRCGDWFQYDYGKPLCRVCLRKYRQRRDREASFPKCRCGATLGLITQQEGLTSCGRCREAEKQAARNRALSEFADRLIDGGY